MNDYDLKDIMSRQKSDNWPIGGINEKQKPDWKNRRH
jgi:hypothetical protein